MAGGLAALAVGRRSLACILGAEEAEELPPPPPVASPLRAELALREPGLESLQPSPPRAPTPPRNT